MRGLAVFAVLWLPVCSHAAQLAGTVRAADQLIPGATVTARAGESKIIAYTDENGRYTLDLKPGVWEVEITMFGFDPQHTQITIAGEPTVRDWTIEMPRPHSPVGQSALVGGQTPRSGRDFQFPPGGRNRPQFARGGIGRGGTARGAGRGP